MRVNLPLSMVNYLIFWMVLEGLMELWYFYIASSFNDLDLSISYEEGWECWLDFFL